MLRIEVLKGILKDNPSDSFSRYALALEYVKLGRLEDARREMENVVANDPGYVATYYQLGQLYEKMSMRHEAEKTYRAGMTAAGSAGDLHTQGELAAALDAILAG